MPTHRTPLRALLIVAAVALALAATTACSKKSGDGASSGSSDLLSPKEACAKVLGDKVEAMDKCIAGLTKIKEENPESYACQVGCAEKNSDMKAMAKCAKKCERDAANSGGEGGASLSFKEKKADRMKSGTLGKALTEKKGYKFLKSTPVAGGKAYHYLAGVKSSKPEAFTITITPIKDHASGKAMVDKLTAGKAQNTVGYAGNKQAVIVACVGQGSPPTKKCHASRNLSSVLKAIF